MPPPLAYYPPADDPIRVPVAEIETDPARLQFRPFDGPDGLSAGRRDAAPYDAESAPPLGLWLDPDGWRLLAVDGHKRLAAAKQSGASHVLAHLLDAPDADAAREVGRGLNADDPAPLADRVFAASEPRDEGHVWQGPSGAWYARHADVTRAFAAGPPRPGLVPQTGDAEHPGHWVRPETAGGSSSNDAPAEGTDARTSEPADQPAPPEAETRAVVEDAVRAADPAAAASPGLLAKLGDRAVTAAAKAHLALARLTPAMLKAVDAVSAVLDTPDDAKKFGYAFGSSGSAAETAGGAADPVKASLGINSHLAATIAAKVVGAGLVWVKNKTGVRLYAADGDVAMGAAEALHAAFAAVAAEFGLEAPPGVEVIAERIRAAGGN